MERTLTGQSCSAGRDRSVDQFFRAVWFPESHAASFALIAYASAWLKFHYLGAFTAAILNNQPMGFYSAAVLVKDAQRHGLRIKPVDVLRSSWSCTLEKEDNGKLSLRWAFGTCAVCGRRVPSNSRGRPRDEPFASIEELARRAPSLTRADLTTLAEVGALNSIGEGIHRRDALWQVERAGRKPGPLLEELYRDEDFYSPLRAMEPTRGWSRITLRRVSQSAVIQWRTVATQLRTMEIIPAKDLCLLRHGVKARIAGCVIARQRPGTAHGFIFLSIEDETGISNAIIDPDLYERNRSLVTYAKFLLIEGALQNVDKVIHIRAKHIEELNVTAAPMQSHDFH
jgi:error-prone DNA polymerase